MSLDELRTKVETIADKITELKKANPVDKDAIGASVKELLDAKRAFAQSNNGIGVDGNPWEEPMSKADKKKKAKAEKAAAAAAAGGGGEGKVSGIHDCNLYTTILIVFCLKLCENELDLMKHLNVEKSDENVHK